MNKIKIAICAGLMLSASPAFALMMPMGLPDIGEPGELFSEIIEHKKAVFALIDTNGDGEISVTEFDLYSANLMKKVDTNNDGRLGRGEVMEMGK